MSRPVGSIDSNQRLLWTGSTRQECIDKALDVQSVHDAVVVEVTRAARRRRIAGIADAIAVGVLLAGIWHRRAVVASVAYAIAVTISLVWVCHGRTVVAGITDTVRISIRLIGVGNRDAVIAGIASSITVGILLAWIENIRAVIDVIGNSVGIEIGDKDISGSGVVAGGEVVHPCPDNRSGAVDRNRYAELIRLCLCLRSRCRRSSR